MDTSKELYNDLSASIRSLLGEAKSAAGLYSWAVGIKAQESVVNTVQSYITAITTLISAHPALHNELIEHETLVLLRRFVRSPDTYGDVLRV